MKHITTITTNTISKVYCIIPAAGLGERFQSDIPKQYTSILNLTVLEHTLIKFCNLSFVKKIIVPLSQKDSFFDNLSIKNHPKILSIEGGGTRFHSVLQGLKYLSPIQDNDWILVHDAVRPGVLIADIKRLLKKIKNHEAGGLLGTFFTDTLKKISLENYVLKTIPREKYVQAQTPQIFRKKLLMDAYEHVLKFHSRHLEKFTDESSLIEALGFHPLVVKSSPQNIKLTYPEDLLLMSQILSQKSKDKP